MNNKTGLGKGLSALIPDSVSNQGTNLVDKNKSEQDILMTPGSELRHVLLADIERILISLELFLMTRNYLNYPHRFKKLVFFNQSC